MNERIEGTSLDNKLHTFDEVKEKYFVYISNPSSREMIEKAYNLAKEKHASQFRRSGEPYIHHLIEVCYILTELNCGPTTLIAGLLHDVVEDTDTPLEYLKEEFGDDVASIVDSLTKIQRLKLSHRSEEDFVAEDHRKIFLGMAKDVRVIVIKLADRLHNMRTLDSLPAHRQIALAKETIEVFVPIAHRLGINTIKSELENLSLKYLEPEKYNEILNFVNKKIKYGQKSLEGFSKRIADMLFENNIPFTMESRVKSIYSIYRKIYEKHHKPEEIFDLLAVRIITKTELQCYEILGIIHATFKPIPGRFKDYIAMPKSNGYQSLHTTVMCKDRPLEIQIRTQKMHDIAEHGVASHWLYKKGMNHDLVDVKNLGIFNQLQELKVKNAIDSTVFNNLKNDLLEDKIVVFTPKGEVKELPIGSTAIDFAYAIHSAIGEKIVGAKADGKIIPLNQELKNTQIIEIITNPNAHPTQNQLKLVKSSKARQKIHSYLMANDPTFSEANAKDDAQDNSQAQRRVHHKGTKSSKKNQDFSQSQLSGRIKIGNTTNFMITFAKCCNPKPGDAICGYVSKMRGITIHRADCYTYNKIQDLSKRAVDVSWEQLAE
ncbi:MAG: RelA/SpoT family protein [Bacilli bacterium]|nr:RelA/SpoT family protein [Bacilli bacterium]